MKTCTKCKQKKTSNEFGLNKKTTDELESWCKFCKNQANKKYNKDHREIGIERNKKFRLENKEHTQNYWKKYYLNNKIKRDNYRRKYESKRRKTDITYKIKHNLRNRIYITIKGYTKTLSTMLLIGCEIDYLLHHLQSQFTKGMSWNNYGKWEIDHIKPCASFDLSKPEEQRKCFNYTNLQPLWAKDNRIKSNKWKNEEK